MKKILIALVIVIPGLTGDLIRPASAAKIVATMNNIPITDADINSRVSLMRLQNYPEKDISVRALQNIIEDLAKLDYANSLPGKIAPTKTEIEENIKGLEKQMGKNEGYFKLAAPNAEDQLNLASAANLAWQKTLFQRFAPQVSVSEGDIERELETLSLTHGLPVKITLVMDGDCKNSSSKITAYEHDLEPAVRQAIANLPEKKWSEEGGQKFMVCKREKDAKEFEQAKNYAENQAIWKRAMFDADQELKSMRRRAVVIILDKKYNKAAQ
ncbi:MAG: hypothetical protein LBG89_00310 [Rickettsiales bacterium]|jgi:peptidyl-tRNA hydrolase|nr:hypothetical protein [Rickettsiales bacterium]